jgi:hypothetical protein
VGAGVGWVLWDNSAGGMSHIPDHQAGAICGTVGTSFHPTTGGSDLSGASGAANSPTCNKKISPQPCACFICTAAQGRKRKAPDGGLDHPGLGSYLAFLNADRSMTGAAIFALAFSRLARRSASWLS